MKTKTAIRFFLLVLAVVAVHSRYSSSSRAQEKPRALSVKVGATEAEAAGGREIRRWAVVIGISRYKFGGQPINGTTVSDLDHAASDAKQVYDFLRSPEGGGFRDESEGGNLSLLLDEQATKANVERALEKLKGAKPEDYFFIYIAAHGANLLTRDTQSGANVQVPYFILHEFDPRVDPAQTSYRMDSFQTLVKQIPAKKGLVISDTCHSAGVLLPGRGLFVTQTASTRFIEQMRQVPAGVGFIASADQSEYAIEAETIGGVFTYCLLEALRGNGDNNPPDGVVTFREAFDYTRNRVIELTNNRQHPVPWLSDNNTNRIPLSLVSYPVSPCIEAQRCGTLVISTPDLDGVAVTVNNAALGQFDRRLQRTVRVPIGTQQLSFVKDGLTRNLTVNVEPQKSKYVEVNLSFSDTPDTALAPDPATIIPVPLPHPRQAKAEAAFLAGVEAFNKRDFVEAMKQFNKAMSANGGPYPDALVYLGRAQQALKQSDKAVASFAEAVRQRPTDYEARTLLAEAKLEAGLNMQEVVAELKQVITTHPRFAFARVVYADTVLYNSASVCGDTDHEQALRNAEQHLRLALSIDPNYAPAHLILANVLMYMKSKAKKREAVTHAETALKLFVALGQKKATLAKSMSSLSLNHLIFGSGRYDDKSAQAEANFILAQALTHLVEAAEQSPTECERTLDLNNQGDNLRRARDPHIGAALRLAQEVRDPLREIQVTTLSAQNYLLMGDVTKAIADGERALVLSQKIPAWKGYPPAHLVLSQAYASNQKYRQAYDHLLRYTQLTPCLLPSDRDELVNLKRLADANQQK